MISKGLKKYRLFFLCLMMAPVFSTLTGCARPNDEDMVDMLSKAYQCKWIKVDSYEKTDSLPGIWSYIAQYDFKLRFREGEAGAYKFMKGMYNTEYGHASRQGKNRLRMDQSHSEKRFDGKNRRKTAKTVTLSKAGLHNRPLLSISSIKAGGVML